jgi:shikimate kinase
VGRILLIGMMGSGKTTVGRAVAALTGWPYLDNDVLVQLSTGRPTPQVLAGADEATLRAAERDALDAALAAEPPLVASVAAGVVLDAAARRRMHASGFVVYLRASLEELAARVGDGSGRPWLGDDPRAALAALAAGRGPLYEEAAHLVLDVGNVTPDELAERIVAATTASEGSPTREAR